MLIIITYTCKPNVYRTIQGHQTRQNSGGVADLTKGGYKNFEFLLF